MSKKKSYKIGILPGEGIGPVVINKSVLLLEKVFQIGRHKLTILRGPGHGNGKPIKDIEEIYSFLDKCFRERIPVLTGPLTGGAVYKIRKKFNLFYKLVPVSSSFPCSKLNSDKVVDILLIRQNNAGMYFGTESLKREENGSDSLKYAFSYSKKNLEGIAGIAYQYASRRKKKISLALKLDGSPKLVEMWKKIFIEIGRKHKGVKVRYENADQLAGGLIASPENYDVIVAQNVEGDILSDMLVTYIYGSRNIGYSGNFDGNGAANYQTIHGAAIDYKRINFANPIGQILSSAMLLEYSLGLTKESRMIKLAVKRVLEHGYGTEDINYGKQKVDAIKMTQLIMEEYVNASNKR